MRTTVGRSVGRCHLSCVRGGRATVFTSIGRAIFDLVARRLLRRRHVIFKSSTPSASMTRLVSMAPFFVFRR
jgi:hypothetical protein